MIPLKKKLKKLKGKKKATNPIKWEHWVGTGPNGKRIIYSFFFLKEKLFGHRGRGVVPDT